MFSGWNLGDMGCNDPEEKKVEMSYDVNDIVICRIRDGEIVGFTEKYNDKISVKIIGWKDHTYSTKEFIVYVPEYEFARLKSDVIEVVTRTIAKDFGIEPRFVDEHMMRIRGIHVDGIAHKEDGQRCSNCHEYYAMAAPNMPDNTFYCSACKLNPWR